QAYGAIAWGRAGDGPPRASSPCNFLSASEAIQDLVGPEAFEAMQRLVEHAELVGVDAADLLDRAHVLLIKRVDDVAHLAAFVGELDAHRAPIDARALMIEETHLDEFLEIVGNVRAEIVATRAQLTGGEFLVADIVEQQRLHRIDVGAAAAVELVFDHVKQAPMQPLDERQGIEIERPDMVEARLPFGGLDPLFNGLHRDAFPYVCSLRSGGALFSPSLLRRTIRRTFEDRLKL